MQKFISKYLLAAHLALTAVAPLVLYPWFAPGDIAVVLLWLSLPASVWLLMEPSRRGGEMPYASRVRVARAIARDPLFWVLVAVAALAAVRWLNSGVAERFDPETSKWYLSGPCFANFPGSAEGGAGFLEFACAVALVPVLTGCRHALGKHARVAFLFVFSLGAGLGAVAAVAFEPSVSCAGRDATLSSSGQAWGLAFLSGIVAFAGCFDCGWQKMLLLFSAAAGTAATGLAYFAPAWTVCWFAIAGAAVMLGCIAYVAIFVSPSASLKLCAGYLFAAAVPVAVSLALVPSEISGALLESLKPFPLSPDLPADVLPGRLSEIASSVWRDHVWTGTGIGSFGLDVRFSATAADWEAWTHGVPSAAPSAFATLFAERGILGAAMLALPCGFLLFGYIAKLIASLGRRPFLPLSVLGPAGALAVAGCAFFDSSLTRPETLLAAGALFALSASSFAPRRKPEASAAPGKGE